MKEEERRSDSDDKTIRNLAVNYKKNENTNETVLFVLELCVLAVWQTRCRRSFQAKARSCFVRSIRLENLVGSVHLIDIETPKKCNNHVHHVSLCLLLPLLSLLSSSDSVNPSRDLFPHAGIASSQWTINNWDQVHCDVAIYDTKSPIFCMTCGILSNSESFCWSQ